MSNREPESQITIEEIQAANATAFGGLVGQQVIKNLSLEKQIQALAGQRADLEAENLTLKQDNSNLTERLLTARSEIDRIIKTGLSADQIAAQGNAAIAVARNEKAAQD